MKPLGVTFSFSICVLVFRVFVYGVSLFVSFVFFFFKTKIGFIECFTCLTVFGYFCLHVRVFAFPGGSLGSLVGPPDVLRSAWEGCRGFLVGPRVLLRGAWELRGESLELLGLFLCGRGGSPGILGGDLGVLGRSLAVLGEFLAAPGATRWET